MLECIRQQRTQKLPVSCAAVQLRVKLEAQLLGVEHSASNGWLQKFIERNHLSYRRGTTQCHKDPDQVGQHTLNFILFNDRMRLTNSYPLSHIYNAEEVYYLFVHLCIYPLMHLFIYAFIHLCIYPFMHLSFFCIYPFIHLCIYSFMHLSIYAFIHLCIYPFMHLFIYAFIHLCIYPFMHLFMKSFIYEYLLFVRSQWCLIV